MIKCPYTGCSFEDPHQVVLHLKEMHRLTPLQILDFTRQGTKLWAEDVLPPLEGERTPIPLREIDITFAGWKFKIHEGVEDSACLKLPSAWTLPSKGKIQEAMSRASLAVKHKTPTFIHGPAGTGKDGFFHAFSYFTRTPADKYSISPDADISSWFYTRDLTKDGTAWTFGKLWKQLTEGYTTTSGTKIPYLIIFSDLDRGTPAQVEYLRLALDTIERTVKGPDGTTYPLFPGTLIVATANSMGATDSRGVYVSTRPMDASILSRFGAKIHFPYWEWEDELRVLQAQFPRVMRDKTISGTIQKVAQSIREEIRQGKILMEFGLREIVSWIFWVDCLLQEGKPLTKGNLAWAFLNILDGLPDQHNQQVLVSKLNVCFPELVSLAGAGKK